jgi:hypothetical protein
MPDARCPNGPVAGRMSRDGSDRTNERATSDRVSGISPGGPARAGQKRRDTPIHIRSGTGISPGGQTRAP